MVEFDLNAVLNSQRSDQYDKHLSLLKNQGLYIESIKETVERASTNLKEGKRSFIVYGDPQSGKTEMMISLTAKLLDEGHKIIIILLPDQVTLLNQNLLRFKEAGLSPSPKNYKDILGGDVEVRDKPLVIFCKKNYQDLEKLIQKLGQDSNKIIIDDEADYATPNSKINRNEVSKINKLTGDLISKGSTYIGVTATPARLDLNNTHKNRTSAWVKFNPHPNYTGQDHFFPLQLDSIKYKIFVLPDDYDSSYLKTALLNFLINVAFLNLNPGEKGYSMLIHTSRKKIDHSEDKKEVMKIMNVLSKKDGQDSQQLWAELFEKAKVRYPGYENPIIKYISDNIERHDVKVLNSNRDKTLDSVATKPIDPFTVIIGGDIISRGVTFDRLLSMFFTRDVIHSFGQDTYIQRARMFGSRKGYLEYFELFIPERLFSDWHNCFIFHRLSLKSIQYGNGPPLWVEAGRIRAVSPSSIDKETVVINNGELKSGLFDYTEDIKKLLSSDKENIEKLKDLSSNLGETFPKYIVDFIQDEMFKGDKISLKVGTVMGWGKDTNKVEILRDKRFIRGSDESHQFLILFNDSGKARLFYRPSTKNLRLIINQRK
jgi:hypothetical protein